MGMEQVARLRFPPTAPEDIHFQGLPGLWEGPWGLSGKLSGSSRAAEGRTTQPH